MWPHILCKKSTQIVHVISPHYRCSSQFSCEELVSTWWNLEFGSPSPHVQPDQKITQVFYVFPIKVTSVNTHQEISFTWYLVEKRSQAKLIGHCLKCLYLFKRWEAAWIPFCISHLEVKVYTNLLCFIWQAILAGPEEQKDCTLSCHHLNVHLTSLGLQCSMWLFFSRISLKYFFTFPNLLY